MKIVDVFIERNDEERRKIITEILIKIENKKTKYCEPFGLVENNESGYVVSIG